MKQSKSFVSEQFTASFALRWIPSKKYQRPNRQRNRLWYFIDRWADGWMQLYRSITLLIRCIALCLPSSTDLLSNTKQTIYCRFALTLRAKIWKPKFLSHWVTLLIRNLGNTVYHSHQFPNSLNAVKSTIANDDWICKLSEFVQSIVLMALLKWTVFLYLSNIRINDRCKTIVFINAFNDLIDIKHYSESLKILIFQRNHTFFD